MKTIYLPIGLPGSGKSTFAKNNLSTANVIELDKIRQQLSDEGIIQKNYSSADNPVVFAKFHEEIKNKIQTFNEIVVDATNARLSEREEIYELLKDFKPKYVVINFIDSKEVVLPRILKRQQENPNCVHVFANPEEALEIYEKRIQEGKATLNEPIAEIWTVEKGKVIKKEQKILIASTNPGKIAIYSEACNELGLKTTSLKEIKIDEKVEENGKNETENAIIKALAYHKITGLPVFANDSGLIIDKFKSEDQPGALVRRFKGKELSDQELLNVYIEKLNEVGGESSGHYIVALAAIDFNGNLKTGLFYPPRHFISKPSKILLKGIPLSSLSYDEKTGKYMSEMTPKEQNEYEADAFAKQKQFIKETFALTNKENL